MRAAFQVVALLKGGSAEVETGSVQDPLTIALP